LKLCEKRAEPILSRDLWLQKVVTGDGSAARVPSGA
jgi:hypothetical protein